MCQPTFDPPGGTNAVACWMLQALLSDDSIDDVAIVCFTAPDLARCDAFYGTSLSTGRRPSVRLVPWPITKAFGALPVPAWLLRQAVFLKLARRARKHDELVVSCCNEFPVHDGCISYVHYPAHLRPRPQADLRAYHRPLLLRAYYGFVDGVFDDDDGADHSDGDGRRGRRRYLCNSAWTAHKTRQAHPGADVAVLSPPVPPIVRRGALGDQLASAVPTIVAAGRLSPEKRFEDAIDIVCGLRRRGHPHRLVIVGAADNAAYAAALRARARASGCTTLLSAVDRAQYEATLSSAAVGLSCMHDEHFGIAVAELTSAGALTFVHNSGGPPEIVGDARLCFSSVDDAIDRIDAVLHDDAVAAELRGSLGAFAARAAPSTFMTAIQREVRAALDAALDATLAAAS